MEKRSVGFISTWENVWRLVCEIEIPRCYGPVTASAGRPGRSRQRPPWQEYPRVYQSEKVDAWIFNAADSDSSRLSIPEPANHPGPPVRLPRASSSIRQHPSLQRYRSLPSACVRRLQCREKWFFSFFILEWILPSPVPRCKDKKYHLVKSYHRHKHISCDCCYNSI